jgi:hypothetical protein
MAMIVFYIRLPTKKKRKKKVGRTIIYKKRRDLSRERRMTEGERERERGREGGREGGSGRHRQPKGR